MAETTSPVTQTATEKWTCNAGVGTPDFYDSGAMATTLHACGQPARWLCVKDRARYCDEHAHVHSCCQMAGPHEGEED